MSASLAPVLEGLASGGAFTALIQGVRAWINRGKTHVDTAEVVQGMALQMVTPLANRLKEADAEVTILRQSIEESHKKVQALVRQLDVVMARALRAEAALREHSIPIPMGD
jgi:hypothetical protein